MNAAETRGIYIVGTDTDVGKTVVGSCLARLLRNKGVDVGVFKPLESKNTAARLFRRTQSGL